MFGKNPKRRPLKGDGSLLQVQEIFPTVQGEGPHTGVPAVFVRLGGCNLACAFCDTEFESFQEMPLAEVLVTVLNLSQWERSVRTQSETGEGPHSKSSAPISTSPIGRGDRRNLVVITGGEPMRQPIAPLCEALLAEGFQVQIETNGTLWQELPPEVEIICSPKIKTPLRPDLLERVTAFKFVLEAGEEVPEVGQGSVSAPVWVQPIDAYDDAQNLANLEHVLALAERHGYKVSLQTHKLAGID